jgi:hypothetical protein
MCMYIHVYVMSVQPNAFWHFIYCIQLHDFNLRYSYKIHVKLIPQKS